MSERSFLYEILTVEGERSSSWTGESIRVLLPEQKLSQSRCCSAVKSHGSRDQSFVLSMCCVMLAQRFFCHLGMVNENFELGECKCFPPWGVGVLFFHLVCVVFFGTLVNVNVSHHGGEDVVVHLVREF